MKPSERIEQLRQDAIGKDWVSFGGNRYSRESWEHLCLSDPAYNWKALMAYFDEKAACKLADGKEAK